MGGRLACRDGYLASRRQIEHRPLHLPLITTRDPVLGAAGDHGRTHAGARTTAENIKWALILRALGDLHRAFQAYKSHGRLRLAGNTMGQPMATACTASRVTERSLVWSSDRRTLPFQPRKTVAEAGGLDCTSGRLVGCPFPLHAGADQAGRRNPLSVESRPDKAKEKQKARGIRALFQRSEPIRLPNYPSQYSVWSATRCGLALAEPAAAEIKRSLPEPTRGFGHTGVALPSRRCQRNR